MSQSFPQTPGVKLDCKKISTEKKIGEIQYIYWVTKMTTFMVTTGVTDLHGLV